MAGPFTPTPIEGLPTREANDYYDTPPPCTYALLDREIFVGKVWEPAAGSGMIVNVARSWGYNCVRSDIVDRGCDAHMIDFLATTELLAPNIITNPPFKLADEFALQAIKLGAEKIAIFQRLAWLEGAKRYDTFWSKHPPVRIWQFSKRQTLWRGDDPAAKRTGGTIAFAWFIFERGFKGAPSMGWIR